MELFQTERHSMLCSNILLNKVFVIAGFPLRSCLYRRYSHDPWSSYLLALDGTAFAKVFRSRLEADHQFYLPCFMARGSAFAANCLRAHTPRRQRRALPLRTASQ